MLVDGGVGSTLYDVTELTTDGSEFCPTPVDTERMESGAELPNERTASKITVKFEEELATDLEESLGLGRFEFPNSATS